MTICNDDGRLEDSFANKEEVIEIPEDTTVTTKEDPKYPCKVSVKDNAKWITRDCTYGISNGTLTIYFNRYTEEGM